MKKTILSLVLAMLCHLSAWSQVGDYRNNLAIGVSGGYILNQVSFDPTIKQTWHGGMTGGVTIRYTSERYFKMYCAIQAEVNYAQMGWKEKIETSEDTYERTTTYVQIPLLARLGFGKEHRGVMGFIVLGPQLGFCLGDKAEKGGAWSEETLALRPNNVVEQYSMDIENKFEYGLTGGAGLEVNTGIGHFTIEARYFYALSDMFDNGKADTFARSANGAIIMKVGYLLDINKKKARKTTE